MDKKAIVESILFASGDPVDIKDLCKLLDLNKKELQNIVEDLEKRYFDSGLRLKVIADKLQLTTNPDTFEYIKEFITIEKAKKLSAAAIEVLSIIAYKQPVTKVEIDKIRGVNSDAIIKRLLLLDLIVEAGNLDKIGKPIIYETSEEFLFKFGLKSIDQLPSLDEDEQLTNLNFLEEK
ncbi:SMC-Scp complex subunit ScpB [Peptoniphilus sp. GNH]|nr:segregation and condensation protein B [Clostridiales bacterium KA00134]UHR03046.1 SMC-Scp complex subunit ScpB [Peptoniphilus sp. GNH]